MLVVVEVGYYWILYILVINKAIKRMAVFINYFVS